MPLIPCFTASRALSASAINLRPPAMATAASAAFSGHLFGLGEFPCSRSLSRCPRFSESWPLALVPRAPATSTPPAMAPCRPEHYFGRPPLLLSPWIYFWQFISNPTTTVGRYPFVGQIAKEPLCFHVIKPAVLSVFPHVRFLVLKA